MMKKQLRTPPAPLATLRLLAASLPGAEEYVMVHHPAFRVGKKPFAIVGMDQTTTLSINLGVEAQQDLLTDERFSRTHYIGQHGWVTVDFPALDAGEVRGLVEGSWQRVAGKKHLAALAASSDRAPAKGPNQKKPPAKAPGKTPKTPVKEPSKKKAPAQAPGKKQKVPARAPRKRADARASV